MFLGCLIIACFGWLLSNTKLAKDIPQQILGSNFTRNLPQMEQGMTNVLIVLGGCLGWRANYLEKQKLELLT